MSFQIMYTLVKIIPNKSTTLFKGKIEQKKKNSDTKEDKKGQTESEIIILWMCQGAIHEKGEGVDLIKSATVSAESNIMDPVFPSWTHSKGEFVSVRFNKQNEVSAGFFELFQDDWMWSCDQNRGVRVPLCFLHLKERFAVFMCRDGSTFGKNSSPTLQDTSSRHLQMFPQLLWGTQLWFRT